MANYAVDGLEEEIVRLKAENDRLMAAVALAVEAFNNYGMDVETYPTTEHVRLMNNLYGVLAQHDAAVIGNLKFPVMLRKLWSGAEVQAWLANEANRVHSINSSGGSDEHSG
ncbi:hypothetical protein [Marinobacterium sp. BA1]|uniref:hypothetical protein n=1 Tax=Marinobacterium sp. BA1 TaxID=3138931 RepID=UPI0032E79394